MSATTSANLIYRPQRVGLSKVDPATLSPAVEPVTVTDMKEHGYVETTDDDTQIEEQISAARRYVEGYLNRALITQTWTFRISEFPSADYQLIELPGGRLQSVTSITYTDTDGAVQTWGASNYDVDTYYEPGRVGLAYNASWPTARAWALPITITYSVGYGASGSDVPADIRQAIKHMAAFLYENRGDMGAKVPVAVKTLSSRYRVYPTSRVAD